MGLNNLCGKNDKLTHVREIGLGAFGRVFLTQDENRCLYACKVVEKNTIGSNVESELQILKMCNHPFIIKFAFAFQNDSSFFVGMDYASQGELLDVIDEISCLDDVIFYASEIALGLDYLHSMNIYYGDLKPENVVLGNDGHIRLIDFGLSKVLKGPNEKVVSHSGTLGYCAPEVLKRIPHGVEIDWWSFGVLLFEMTFGDLPFWDIDDNIENICQLTCQGDLPIPSSMCQKEKLVFDLCKKLLNPVKNARLENFNEISSHFLFSCIKWEKMEAKKLSPPFISNFKCSKTEHHLE